MTQHRDGSETAQAIRDFSATDGAKAIREFIAVYDRTDPEDRRIAARIGGMLQSELYRREREEYPEWIDIGGEAGSA
jgi:hypothetical protein